MQGCGSTNTSGFGGDFVKTMQEHRASVTEVSSSDLLVFDNTSSTPSFVDTGRRKEEQEELRAMGLDTYPCVGILDSMNFRSLVLDRPDVWPGLFDEISTAVTKNKWTGVNLDYEASACESTELSMQYMAFADALAHELHKLEPRRELSVDFQCIYLISNWTEQVQSSRVDWFTAMDTYNGNLRYWLDQLDYVSTTVPVDRLSIGVLPQAAADELGAFARFGILAAKDTRHVSVWCHSGNPEESESIPDTWWSAMAKWRTDCDGCDIGSCWRTSTDTCADDDSV